MMTDISTLFPLPWSVGSYGFDIKAANGLHVDEICSASDEDGDKELSALICRAVNNHDALVKALEWIRDNPSAHHVNIHRVAREALAGLSSSTPEEAA